MNYREFFQKFYISRSEGHLLEHKAQKKIPEFFFQYGLEEEYLGLLPTSESAYEKYFRSDRQPTKIWGTLSSHFDEDKLLKQLLFELNESKLRELLVSFDVVLEPTEIPNKRQLANAIVAQFEALAAGNGTADDIVPIQYKKPPEPTGFDTYIRGAVSRFKWMRLPSEDEQLLDDVFVCSNIGTSAAVFPHRVRGSYIENATLEKIRTMNRHTELKHALIIGACGYGKTLMFQHLFLEAAEKRNETGLLPIFAELRNFSSLQKDFLQFLTEAVREFDRNFTQDDLVGLLEKGQAQILLDGLDEMDPEETIHFQKKIGELIGSFPNNQVVISSRHCSAIKGIRGFVKLYLHPMAEEQANKLIEKLLQDCDDPNAKDTVLSFTKPNTGYIVRNGFVATNPMLLTIMVRKYKELRDCGGDRIKFYEIMYNALIKEHDEEKQAFGRFFHSVSDADEFTTVFREFCAKTYVDGEYEFDHRKFERYFNKLNSKDELVNPSKFKLKSFQQDVCATACMMYEQESGIYYIDPGFQDYFFAEYYYFQDTEPTKEMAKQLQERHTDSFRSIEALKMLYQMSKEKADVCFLLPYLDEIFKGKSEDEAFLRYLDRGYGEVKYVTLDEGKIQKYAKRNGSIKNDTIIEQNQPKNITVALLLDVLGLPNTFIMGSFDKTLVREEYASHFLTGYFETLFDNENPDTKSRTVLRNVKHDIARIDDPDYFGSMEMSPEPVRDENGKPVCFGYEYKVSPVQLTDSPKQLDYFIELCDKAGLRMQFERIAAYYKLISEAQEKNKLR